MIQQILLILFLLCSVGCLGQTEYTIYERTPLMFITAQDIVAPTKKTSGNKIGDTVDIQLNEDFKKEDVILIKKGSKAVAVIKEIKAGKKESLEFNVGSYGKNPSVIAIDILGVFAIDGMFVELSACTFQIFQPILPIGSVKNCETQKRVIVKPY